MSWFFIVLGSALGLYALLATIVAIRKWFFWRTTEGKVLGHRVEKRFDEEGKKFIEFWIEYHYRVEDVGSFTAEDALVLRPAYHEEDEAIQRMIDAYTPGTLIEVYHGPNRPEMSSLSRGIGLLQLLGSIFSLLMILFFYYIYYLARMSDVQQ